MKKIYFVLIVLSAACNKSLERDQRAEAIIEAYLLPRQPVSVRISREMPWGTSDTLLPIEGLKPVFLQNNTRYDLTYMGKGLYGNPAIQLQEMDSCMVGFEYNGRSVVGMTRIPDRPTGFSASTDTVRRRFMVENDPEAIVFNWNNPRNDYHFVLVEEKGAQKPWWVRPIDPDIAWAPPYITTPTRQPQLLVLNSDAFKTPDSYQLMACRIQPDFAVIHNEVRNYSTNLTDPPNNIINGYGIFTGVSTSDTLFVEVVE